MRIDAHQHFWQFNPIRDGWISDDMSVIREDFLPEDLHPLLDANAMDGCVAVQADQSETETRFLLDLSEKYGFIKGVVGWVDLLSENVEERLAHFAKHPRFKGVRHILQAEPAGFMTNSVFVEGIKQVANQKLTYDILTNERQLPEVLDLVRLLPEMPLVIDHISKPDIKSQSFDHWAKHMHVLSKHEHVKIKLSGMVTEADWSDWKTADFKPYVDYCLEHFTPDRLMFGSDWPVSLLGGAYDRIVRSIEDCIAELTKSERDQIMGNTAMDFYELS